MLSWIIVLSSCAVAVRTPQYDSSGIIIERGYHGNRYYRDYRDDRRDRHNRHERHERHENGEHND